MIQEMLSKAISAHMAWTQTFAEAIASGQCNDVILRRAGADDRCAFGQWLYDLDDAVKATSDYRRVKDKHYVFHVEAGVVARLLLESERGAANAALRGPFAKASGELMQALVDWKQSA
jgi:hypothetical protein